MVHASNLSIIMKSMAVFSVMVLRFVGLAEAFSPISNPTCSCRRRRLDDVTNKHHQHPNHFQTRACLLFLSAGDNNDEDAGKQQPIVTGVTLKLAFDESGGVADLAKEETSGRFTCGASLDMVHRLRRVSDAVLVGRTTVETDDCSLTVRRVPPLRRRQEEQEQEQEQEQQPVRVILDPQQRLLKNNLSQYQIAKDGMKTIIFYADQQQQQQQQSPQEGNQPTITTHPDFPNVTLVGLSSPSNTDNHHHHQLSAREICHVLNNSFSIHHIMVEGGPATARVFLQEGLVDRAILVYAPMSFTKPLPSNLTCQDFEQAGLTQLGTSNLGGVDRIEYWSRPSIPWPSSIGSSNPSIESWP